MTTPAPKGNPASAQPMQGLSKRAQALLAPMRNPLTVGPRFTGIPQAMRTTKGGN